MNYCFRTVLQNRFFRQHQIWFTSRCHYNCSSSFGGISRYNSAITRRSTSNKHDLNSEIDWTLGIIETGFFQMVFYLGEIACNWHIRYFWNYGSAYNCKNNAIKINPKFVLFRHKFFYCTHLLFKLVDFSRLRIFHSKIDKKKVDQKSTIVYSTYVLMYSEYDAPQPFERQKKGGELNNVFFIYSMSHTVCDTVTVTYCMCVF